MTNKEPYNPKELLIRIFGWIVLLLFLILCFIGEVKAQGVFFTDSELMQLAEQNLERKQCLEYRELDQLQIDSLNQKCKLKDQQISYQDSIISNYRLIGKNFDRIEAVQEEKIDLLKKNREEDRKTIRKQNRKLTFWRIITPTAITGIALVGILTK